MKLSLSATFLCLLLAMGVSAAPILYNVTLTGPQEPTNSPGVGFGTVAIDTTAHTMTLNVSFSGLTANTSASHIHAPTAVAFTGTAGVATTTPSFAGFPLGVTSGTFSSTLDMTLATSYNPAFVTANGGTTAGAEAALAAAAAAGKAYWNIHTTAFPNGEIRGFLVAAPEPTTVSMSLFAMAGLAALAAIRRRR